jgi:lipopolysaccharide export LptBFGC system permease protein LptF
MKPKVKKFLEQTKLIAETLSAVIPIAKLVLVFAGVLGLVMVVKYNGQQDEMDRYIAQYKEYKTQAEATSKFADSLQTQITIQENETRAALSRADVAARKAEEYKAQTNTYTVAAVAIRETVTDTIELARTLIPLQDSIIAQQQLTIEAQDVQITELNTALNSKDVSLKLALQRGDSLQTVLNLLPPPPSNPNRMFGIKLPSRKASFLVGLGMGLGASLLVIK